MYYNLTPEGVEAVPPGPAIPVIARTERHKGNMLVTEDGAPALGTSVQPGRADWWGRFPS